MKIGDKVTKALSWGDISKEGAHGHPDKVVATGTVVYIHPKRRFYVLEFTFPAGKFRESFFF